MNEGKPRGVKEMKNYFLCLAISLVVGGLFCFGLAYAAGAFMSDEEYLETHPEVMEKENYKDYFSNDFTLKEVK